MTKEIIACLDGSEFAEAILPYAVGVSRSLGADLSLLTIVGDGEAPVATRDYLKRLADHYAARAKIKKSTADAASAILEELQERPFSLPVMTTHGRTGMLEALLGSVAVRVVRGADRPVLLYHPRPEVSVKIGDTAVRFTSVVAALDGQDFAKKIIPHAAELASALKARLELVQALPQGDGNRKIPAELRGDVLESSYVQHEANDARRKYGVEVDGEVLHGQPAGAIIRYVKGRPDALLAMTSHARSGLERSIFGSVAMDCLRRAGVPMLVYWPRG